MQIAIPTLPCRPGVCVLVMCVVPSVGRDHLLLGPPQGVECLLGMSTKLNPSIGGLGLLNVMNRAFSGAMRTAYGIRCALGGCVAVLAIGVVCQRWAPETGQPRLAELDQNPGASGGSSGFTQRGGADSVLPPR